MVQACQFEVETILGDAGGKVVLRFGDSEAQFAPLDAQRLALALVEAAATARAESWLIRFLQDQLEVELGAAARVIASFRAYRAAELLADERADAPAAPGGKP